MGQKKIIGDLDVVGTITQNGSPIGGGGSGKYLHHIAITYDDCVGSFDYVSNSSTPLTLVSDLINTTEVVNKDFCILLGYITSPFDAPKTKFYMVIWKATLGYFFVNNVFTLTNAITMLSDSNTTLKDTVTEL